MVHTLFFLLAEVNALSYNLLFVVVQKEIFKLIRTQPNTFLQGKYCTRYNTLLNNLQIYLIPETMIFTRLRLTLKALKQN